MIRRSLTATASIETRLSAAIRWWVDSNDNSPTSSILGSGAIRTVEEWFASCVGHDTGVAVASGTQALIAALQALDIGEHSTVALAAYDWPAAASAVLALGASPVWCDAGPNGVITPDTIDGLDEPPDAIIATDLHGYPVDVDGIKRRWPGIAVIEDCTQATFASRRGQLAGSRADIAVWSIGSGKLLDAGEGGICTTDDRALGERLEQLTQHPIRQRSKGLSPWLLGTVARMHPASAILAAFAIIDVEHQCRARRDRGQRLAELARTVGVAVPVPEPEVEPAWHRVVALESQSGSRNGVAVGAVVYPDSPAALLDFDVPADAARWSTMGRVVRSERLRAIGSDETSQRT